MEIIRYKVGPIETNCYILRSDNEAVIIDPGDEAEMLAFKAGQLGVKIKYIINTHCHYDHVDGNEELKVLTDAQILIHEAEKPYIAFTPDHFLKNGEEISFGHDRLKVNNFPGHTPGSICLFGNDFVFTGDILFADGVGRTDMDGGNQKQMEESLRRLHKMIGPGFTVYPGHGAVFKYKDKE